MKRYELRCACGFRKLYRNPVAAQWGGERHLPYCVFYNAAQGDTVAKIWYERAMMAPKNKSVDDPFSDDDWGMPAGQTLPESDDMPAANTEEKPPFLRPHHVGKQEMGKLTLLRVTSETSEYSDVILLVKWNEKTWRIGLKLYSEDYKRLLARFGPKKADWKGELRYKVLPHKGNPKGYIAVR